MPAHRLLRIASSIIVTLTVVSLLPGGGVAAQGSGVSSLGDFIVVLDTAGNLRDADILIANEDRAKESVSIEIQDADSGALRLLVREGWLRDLVPNPGFGEVRFDMTSYNDTSWYEFEVPDPRAASTILAREFRPEVSRSSFTKGSPRSVSLERPMFVALEEIPRVNGST